MPQSLKWSLIAGLALICSAAAYLMVERGPALLLDLSGALAGCF